MLTTLTAALAAIAIAWPMPWYPGVVPESAPAREVRLTENSEVVALVALDNQTSWSPEEDAALVETVWAHESAFEYYVQAGGDSPLGDQDGGLARCMGQIHTWPGNKHLPTKADHKALAGLDKAATERCARVTLAYLWGHGQRCLRTRDRSAARWAKPLLDYEVAILFASYGAGKCEAVAQRHKNRARTYRRVMREIDGRKAK